MTFGEHLKQFALSIDFLDAGHYELVQRQLLKYLEIQLNAIQVAFFERIRIDDCDGIATVWSAPTFRIQQTLREGNEYRRQLALALGSTRNLWVISGTDAPLSPEHRGVDLWGETEDRMLPPFCPAPGALPTRTSISMITRDSQGAANGVLLVNIMNNVRPTKILRRELQLLADAVGLLHATDWTTREQHRGTANAIARLADLIPDAELETGPRPFLFVATSSKADPDVNAAINEVLKEFHEDVFARHWSEMHRPGNINVQLVEQIRGAQFGICYLSEPVDGADGRKAKNTKGHRFHDNPNVLVEAGMLHMVTRTAGSTDTGWIPIRERDSPNAPFDLEHERMVLVDRNEGLLDADAFKDKLRKQLSSLLKGDESLWGLQHDRTAEVEASAADQAPDKGRLTPVSRTSDGKHRAA